MFIDGQFVDAVSQKTYDVYNPATGEVIARVPLADKEDVDTAVAAASRGIIGESGQPRRGTYYASRII